MIASFDSKVLTTSSSISKQGFDILPVKEREGGWVGGEGGDFLLLLQKKSRPNHFIIIIIRDSSTVISERTRLLRRSYTYVIAGEGSFSLFLSPCHSYDELLNCSSQQAK